MVQNSKLEVRVASLQKNTRSTCSISTEKYALGELGSFKTIFRWLHTSMNLDDILGDGIIDFLSTAENQTKVVNTDVNQLFNIAY